MASITVVPTHVYDRTDEVPIVADPDLCADDDMPDTVPDPRVFHYDGFEVHKGRIRRAEDVPRVTKPTA